MAELKCEKNAKKNFLMQISTKDVFSTSLFRGLIQIVKKSLKAKRTTNLENIEVWKYVNGRE